MALDTAAPSCAAGGLVAFTLRSAGHGVKWKVITSVPYHALALTTWHVQ